MEKLRPSWTANIATLIENDITVMALCGTCKGSKQIDLPTLAAQLGGDFDLWNRSPRCRITPGCTGRATFHHSGRGVMHLMRDRNRPICW